LKIGKRNNIYYKQFAIKPGVAPAQNEWGEEQTKKFETYGYKFRSLWHTKCSIIFSTPKAWYTLGIITRR